ncbi:Sugar/inositol transporter [Neofusicoccum parvum]|nr:Sugar/inositol transporter [Neofusicoccum parvum]
MGQSAPKPKAITFPLEPTPRSISGNLEWDERNAARHSKHADGMGNLTEGGNDGYLGDIQADDAALFSTGGRNSPVPMPQQIPPPSRLDAFIDDYFSLYHPSYSIIHEATFRAEYMEVIPRPPGTLWHVLLYAISALGACTSGKYPPGTDVALFEAAKSRLSFDILETGSMMLVQVLALMANYVQKANKPNSGYNYLGLAKRVAVGIGLHKEYSDWAVTPWQIEMRRRVWWCLVIFDVGASITFSRPIELPTGIDIGLPQNFRDTDLTRATSRFPAEASETTVYTNLRCQALFDLAIKDIYSALISSPYPSAETLLSLDDSHISRWAADLPPYFRAAAPQPSKFATAHAILHLRHRNFQIIMYRPFVLRAAILRARACPPPAAAADDSSPIAHAIRRCLAAAETTIATVSALWLDDDDDGGPRTPMACWYGIYFLFQAVSIPLVSLRDEPGAAGAAAWRAQVRRAARALAEMAGVNATAGRCLRVVGRMAGPVLREEEDGGMVEEGEMRWGEFGALLGPMEAALGEFGGGVL